MTDHSPQCEHCFCSTNPTAPHKRLIWLVAPAPEESLPDPVLGRRPQFLELRCDKLILLHARICVCDGGHAPDVTVGDIRHRIFWLGS